jgi:hypothetical protein
MKRDKRWLILGSRRHVTMPRVDVQRDYFVEHGHPTIIMIFIACCTTYYALE